MTCEAINRRQFDVSKNFACGSSKSEHQSKGCLLSLVRQVRRTVRSSSGWSRVDAETVVGVCLVTEDASLCLRRDSLNRNKGKRGTLLRGIEVWWQQVCAPVGHRRHRKRRQPFTFAIPSLVAGVKCAPASALLAPHTLPRILPLSLMRSQVRDSTPSLSFLRLFA